MTNTSKMSTRSISKNVYSVTRSGIKYKPSIANNKKKIPVIIQPTIVEAQPHTTVEAVHHTTPFDAAYFVQLACSAIVEVVDLYRVNPNDFNLGYIQEAVGLTAKLHAAYLSPPHTTAAQQ